MPTPFDKRLVMTLCRAVVLTALGILYFIPTFYDVNAGHSRYLSEWLWREGWGKEGSGIWLAFLAGFAILKRKVLFGACTADASTTHRSRWFCTLGGLALYLLGHRMGSLSLVALSGVLALIGLCRAIFPAAQIRLFVAIASLAWVIPGWLAPFHLPLRLLTARMTTTLMGLFADVRRSETFLMLVHNENATLFWVANECSGVSALITLALLATGVTMASNLQSRRGAIILMVAVIIGTLLTNLIRVFIILGGSRWFSPEFGMRLHDTWAGHIALVVVILTGQNILAAMRKRGRLR